MSSLNSSSSKSKCLMCFSLFQSEKCNNPEYSTTVFDVFCRLLGIDTIEPICWDFDQHGIPFCEFCCLAVEKLKEMNDQLELLQQELNNILHITKQNILKSGNSSNGSNRSISNDARFLLINRIHCLRHQFTRGSSHSDDNGSESEDCNPPNTEQFLIAEIESKYDETLEPYSDRSNDEKCIVKVEFSENYPLVEQVENECQFAIGCVLEEEYSTVENLKKDPDSLFLDQNDSVQSSITTANSITRDNIVIRASVIHEGNICTSELMVKPEISTGFKSDYTGREERSCEDDVVGDLDSIFLDPDDVSRVQTSVNQSDSRINKDPLRKTVGSKITPPHMMKHKCDLCGKILSNRANLVLHTRIHTGEKPYKCDVCGNAFASSVTLVHHTRIHTGEKPFKCDLCDKCFRISSDLTKHRRLHSGVKPFECDFCDKRCTTKMNLKLHRRIHTGEAPYECGVCQKKFLRSSNFARHKRSHTGKKPYVCEICKQEFKQLSGLRTHKKLHSGANDN